MAAHRLVAAAAAMALLVATGSALPSLAQSSADFRIEGKVVDSERQPVAEASVMLTEKSGTARTTKTRADGSFVFAISKSGTYEIRTEKAGIHSLAAPVSVLPGEGVTTLELVLSEGGEASRRPGVATASAQAMEFSDQPNFSVAGVTDWTAVGGHGSDSSLRTSEALTRDTLTLKASGDSTGTSDQVSASETRLRVAVREAPDSYKANHELGEFYLYSGTYREAIPPLLTAYRVDPTNSNNEYELALAYKGAGDLPQAREHAGKLAAHGNEADAHRLSGDIDEAAGDPLGAVREYQQAVRVQGSEQNYFAWGAELLLHRAVWQAQEVFAKGAAAYPKSARMLAALGTALFAGAKYDEAAERLCEASDLNPAEPEPYIFLGKIQIAAPASLPCVAERLARFAQEQPENSLASYLYAMALLKAGQQAGSQESVRRARSLLVEAVKIDPKCADAYLQLGVLAFSLREDEKAVGFYKKAVEANPALSEAHYRLGVAYDRMGEATKAKQEFDLHDELEKQQAAAVEKQRREVKQFLVVLQGAPNQPLPK